MSVMSLIRPEIRQLVPYVTARQVSNTLRLNANELPYTTCPTVASIPLNRYPAIRPVHLHEALAEHYASSPKNLLATRGSSEAIDLLIRAFCRAGRDSILVASPTFAMYRVYADIQGARTITVPLTADDFLLDPAAVVEHCEADTKLIFLCSPNNPTGSTFPAAAILELVRARAGRSVVVVDEAYAEFSRSDTLIPSIGDFDNLVVLRTLSKALGLAGVRCGAVLGPGELIGWLDGMLAPYALATPVIDSVLHALAPEKLAKARQAVAETVRQRERLRQALGASPLVNRVWPSQANFLLARFNELQPVIDALSARSILIREFTRDSALANCARITVGTADEIDRLLSALDELSEAS